VSAVPVSVEDRVSTVDSVADTSTDRVEEGHVVDSDSDTVGVSEWDSVRVSDSLGTGDSDAVDSIVKDRVSVTDGVQDSVCGCVGVSDETSVNVADGASEGVAESANVVVVLSETALKDGDRVTEVARDTEKLSVAATVGEVVPPEAVIDSAKDNVSVVGTDSDGEMDVVFDRVSETVDVWVLRVTDKVTEGVGNRVAVAVSGSDRVAVNDRETERVALQLRDLDPVNDSVGVGGSVEVGVGPDSERVGVPRETVVDFDVVAERDAVRDPVPVKERE
jgi:hypothetical protein